MTPLAILRRAAPSLLLFASSSAHACTVCDSPAGRSLRAGIFNGHFLATLLAVALPVPVFAAAVAVIHISLPNSLAPRINPPDGPA